MSEKVSVAPPPFETASPLLAPMGLHRYSESHSDSPAYPDPED
jgi:hypothetical protein